MAIKTFNHIDYLWDESKTSELNQDEIDLFLYRSNILGADLRITNFGGGNTSCKTWETDPLTGKQVEVMWVKGSGGDLGTLKRDGIAGLYVERLKALKNVYKGIEYEDEIVPLYYHCLFDLDSRAPSIDTALHGLLPYRHIDHLHPDALIAIATAKDGKEIMKEIWGDSMAWIPWQRPGFDLGVKLEDCVEKHHKIRGIILGGHGLFTWGNTSHDCYLNSLEVIEMALDYIELKIAKRGAVFGGAKRTSLAPQKRKEQAAKLAPILRGLCSDQQRMVGHFTDDERVLEYINSKDLSGLAPKGTSCPDHFLRTKIQPLVLELTRNEDLTDGMKVKSKLLPSFENYRKEYADYYNTCKHPDSPAIRDPNPVVILYPGVGMFTFAKNKQTARVASEFYINAINVMRGAEAISEYTALPRQEAFNIEYWLLEEAKLKRQPRPKPLSGKIAFISGAGGGIGKAIAHKLALEGANVFLADISQHRLANANSGFKKDISAFSVCDVTNLDSVRRSMQKACLEFGGVDILIHSAGLAISKSLTETTDQDWKILQDVLVKGQFYLSKEAVKIMQTQDLGGDIVNIASKNGIVAGPNNVAYGTAKSAQQHMTRLLASELAKERIRVNTVNPDAVIVGSKIWEGAWAEGRARAYGIKVEDLPEHYANRNLLKEIILPDDIANAVFAILAFLNKSTGNTINVDGGIPAAFLR